MTWIINSSQEETCRLLTDYFDGRSMKVTVSDPPSIIKADFGSWTDMVLNNAKGEATARITGKNGGSSISLNLNFALEYFGAFLMTIVGGMSTYAYYNLLEAPPIWALSVFLIEVVVIWGIVGSSVFLTRRKFIDEFNTFIKSLSAKKQ